ncbi:MAG TPA: hypothetical protein VNC22_21005, partial [Sporichthya sp.]|nr:hypothetical protein [Sporichthya sp.]
MILSLLVVSVAVTVLIGWWLGWGGLTRLLPNSVPVAPNTAVALIVFAGGLLVPSRRVLVASGVAVSVLGAVTLAGDLLDRPDMVAILVPGVQVEGRPTAMAEATAAALVLLGLAVVAFAAGVTWVYRSAPLLAFALGYLAALAYLYDASELYDVIGYTKTARPASRETNTRVVAPD